MVFLGVATGVVFVVFVTLAVVETFGAVVAMADTGATTMEVRTIKAGAMAVPRPEKARFIDMAGSPFVNVARLL